MIEIVPECPERHADAIEALYDQTFGPGHFAKTAERLREFNTSLPALNRLAIEGKDVIGVTRVWPVSVSTGGSALFVGPVAVAASARGEKLGLQLTNASLTAAKEVGWKAAILIGAHSYFGEIGFQRVPPGKLSFPGPQDDERIMVCDLCGDASAFEGLVTASHSTASVDNQTRHSLVSKSIHT